MSVRLVVILYRNDVKVHEFGIHVNQPRIRSDQMLLGRAFGQIVLDSTYFSKLNPEYRYPEWDRLEIIIGDRVIKASPDDMESYLKM